MTEKPDLQTLLRETRALAALLRKDLDEIAALSLTSIQRVSALDHVERLATAFDDIRHRLGRVETTQDPAPSDGATPEPAIGISDRIDAKASAARDARRQSEPGPVAPRPPAAGDTGADGD